MRSGTMLDMLDMLENWPTRSIHRPPDILAILRALEGARLASHRLWGMSS